MQAIPLELQTKFEDHLRSKAIPDPLLWSYKKWLRYYLDYCEKYHFLPGIKQPASIYPKVA
jgi:hypothetical protein